MNAITLQPRLASAHRAPRWQPTAFPAPPQTIEHKLVELKAQLNDLVSDHVAVVRLASHLSILLVAVVILVFSRVELPALNDSIHSLSNEIVTATILRADATATANPNSNQPFIGAEMLALTDLSLPRWVVPFTVKPEEPVLKITAYVVQPGDTVYGIASRLGLQPETVQWANPSIESNPDLLQLGEQLKIPPADGVLHIVKDGETLSSLAQRYKVAVDKIASFAGNRLADPTTQLIASQELFVPGGIKPFEPKPIPAPLPKAVQQAKPNYKIVQGSGVFGWPTTGEVSQGYWGGHRAIDIAGWTGNAVRVADTGTVVEASGGWSYGYGNHVLVDHGNGYQTLYAHLSSIWVSPGETVTKGQQVGAVGNTGRSTGPHLHFEVRYQGAAQNPFSYLR